MRALFVRFKDCEGPGILEPILRENGWMINFFNAYDTRVQILPESHLHYQLIVLLGGPQSVIDPNMDSFFKPYYSLVESILATPKKKLVGICLGSQIIAKTLGATVSVGEKGPEVGFSSLKIKDLSSPVFSGINSQEVQAFHLHEDVFSIPQGSKHLLEGSFYPNQMFSYEDHIFALQTHLEPTAGMLQVWMDVHKEFIAKGKGDFSDMYKKQSEMELSARTLFRNILTI